MNQQFGSRLILAILISISFVACNGNDKDKEKEATTDSPDTTAPTDDNTAGKDAVTVAPGLYKVMADTMGIRMIEVTYKPGDSSAMHWHPDYAVYAIEGGIATFYAKDGSKMDNELKQGVTMITPAGFHSVKNNGKTNIHVLLVEVNRPAQTTSQDAATDATKVAASLYKLKNDTLGIRVLEINYKPGQSSAMHSHGDQALYVLEGGKVEFTGKEGTKNVMEFKKGMAMVVPGDTHSVKNIGTTTLKAILVEVNRAVK
jgi:quercetin dioxygenase-like cupin family protein